MRFIYFSIVMLVLPILSLGQKDSIIQTKVYFDSRPPQNQVDSLYYSVPNALFLTFMEGFNDSVFVFRNEICIDTFFLVTNESIGAAGSSGISFQTKNDIFDL